MPEIAGNTTLKTPSESKIEEWRDIGMENEIWKEKLYPTYQKIQPARSQKQCLYREKNFPQS